MTTDTRETKYYKFLRSDLTHNGYTYQLGLNIDPVPFNPSGECLPGGFYLTTPEYIFKYYEYGPYLGIISLPPNTQIYHEENKLKVNQLILEKIVTTPEELFEIFQDITKKYGSLTMPMPINTCQLAAWYGHLDILKWARKNYYHWNQLTCTYAAQKGHLDVLKWARENDCDWDESTCGYAAKNGHLDILKWARENGCPWNVSTCMYAAKNGHLDILKWARENGCPWNASTCSNAALNGHLDILKWAKENGCEWDSYTCTYAAINGHLDVLKWARENGCPQMQQCVVI